MKATFENERLASLPPKPEEPDGCSVVMGPRASMFFGPLELARIVRVWPKPKVGLAKVDKLSVAGPTFENERSASLPPKPEERDILSGPMELAL